MLHALLTPQWERRRRERESGLHCATRPRIYSHPATQAGEQLLRFMLHFSPWSQFRLLRTVMILTHRWTFDLFAHRASTRTRQGKVLKTERNPISPPLTSVLIARWISEPCPGRRQWKPKVAPRAPRRLRAEAAGGRGKVWPPLQPRPPDWFIPADRPSATVESFMISPSRWAPSSGLTSDF